ncbi:MAG: DUF11 domain-containing protein [Candidatus Nomurabacteria bacterium]|jgi:uncharacterized repeat protein (TIGR01451 family)|nr:DUF11 domain-containing protein [Candidatus Nomurabacteria bacterium]
MKTKKLTLLVLFTLLVGVFIPISGALAWGPDRPQYKWEAPADHPTINSITNNPVLGDERSNFVQIGVAGTQKYQEELTLEAGKEYEVYVYFHNNASASLNASGVGMANNVRMSSKVPSKLEAGRRTEITGVISSSNTDPTTVWDEAYISSMETLYLRYVPGSAVIHSDGSVNGSNLPAADLFSDNGTPIGYSANYWGSLAGCNEYAGYVTYRIKADLPKFTMDKTVSRDGEGAWQEVLEANPGEIVDFKISYKNVGTTEQNDVTLLDKKPSGLEYLSGTTFLTINGANGKFVSDNLFNNGINIGMYQPSSEAIVTYKVRVPNADQLECGVNTFKNTANVVTGDGTQEDDATVKVNKDCVGGEMTKELPYSGPLDVGGAVFGVLALSMGAAYFYRSYVELRKNQNSGLDK